VFALAGSRTPPVSLLPFPNLPLVHSIVDAPTSRVSRPLPHAPNLLLSQHPLAHSPRLVALFCRPPGTPLSHCACTRGALSSSSSCRVHCPDELCLLASNTRHPLVCPQPLYFHLVMLTRLLVVQPCLRRRRPRFLLHPRHCSSTPEPSLEVTDLPVPLIPRFLPCCPHNRLPELMCAAVGPLCRDRALWCIYVGVVPTAEPAVSP
jgi:hypothetical protein